MRRGGGGVIVNVSSEAGLVAIGGQALYNVSKAALVMLTKSIAVDHAADRIRAVTVCPGTTRTPLVERAIGSSPEPQETERALEASRPAGRLGDPGEVASAIVYAVSEGAAFMTGTEIVVDGGYTAVEGKEEKLRIPKRIATVAGAALLCSALAAGCGGGGGGGGGENRSEEEIVIGWTPPDITGVFQTATDYFEQSAEQANQAGFDVRIESRSPNTHTSYSDQIGIIEDFISQDVDVIAVSPASVQTIKPAIRQANQADIPVIMVNLLEEQDDVDVASYVGFDNSVAAEVSAYSVLDYYGGPGVLGEGEQAETPEDG
jgi:hypothetical protein